MSRKSKPCPACKGSGWIWPPKEGEEKNGPVREYLMKVLSAGSNISAEEALKEINRLRGAK